MCSGGSGCVATCFGFYLIVGFVEGSATRCDWPSARRVAPRSRWREKKRKEKVSHALFCFSPPPDKQQQEEEEGGGGREDTDGLPGLFTSGTSHRLDARHRVAPPPANQKNKKCFCKTKKKESCLRKKSKVRTNNENNKTNNEIIKLNLQHKKT